tara:strand:- start:138 stop:860 length:723 start_codon:yes stop_codon:yes gene_type:complete
MKTSILKHDFDKEYKTLVICFSSQPEFDRQEGGRFEWQGFFKDKNVKTLHLRDYNKAYYFGEWYDEAGSKIGSDVNSHVEFLSEIVRESECNRLIMTGASMGGFAAILYGVLLNANSIMSFNPQIYMDTNGSFASLSQGAFDNTNADDQKLYFDLTNLDYEKFDGTAYCHWGSHYIDEAHMKSMKEFCNKNKHLGGRKPENASPDHKISILKHGIGGHGHLCGRLRNMGYLEKYFERYAL